MRRFRASPLCVAVVSAALGVPTAVAAADLPSHTMAPLAPAIPVPVFTWTGVYVGAAGGGDFATNNYQTTSLGTGFTTDGITDFASLHRSRGKIGGFIGYNYQIDQVVLGVEGDGFYNFGSSQGIVGVPGTTSFVGPPDADRTSVNNRYDASVRARLGVTVLPTWLVYATGGVAIRDGSYSINCPGAAGSGNSFCAANESGTNDTTRVGWTVGGGVETVIFNNLIARLEYRYSDFGNHNISFFGPPSNADFFAARTEMNASAVTLGIAYKFGATPLAPVVARY